MYRNLQCLADDGRHVSIAVQGGAQATIPIFEIMRRRLTLTGSTLRARDNLSSIWSRRRSPAPCGQAVWTAGRVKPVIDRTFPLADAAAHARMEAGDHVGKIVLTMG
ncbi:zinc-binding dehydrogenase [Sphingomonas sp. MMS24-JH45]